MLLVVNVGSLEKRSNQPKYKELRTRTSVNLKKVGMASRNIVIKNNIRCFKSALQ